MRRGKYERPKSRRNKKPAILIVSLVLLLIAAVGGTVAYLQAISGRVTNTFTPAEVEITVNETKTDTQKSNISFTNPKTDEAMPVYIRATLVIYWTDIFDVTNDGVENPTEQVIAQPTGASVSIPSEPKDGWFKVGDIYYYSQLVAPGSTTTEMLDAITVSLPDGATAQCHIDIHAEAIQAEPTAVVEAAWKDINVDANGNLVAG